METKTFVCFTTEICRKRKVSNIAKYKRDNPKFHKHDVGLKYKVFWDVLLCCSIVSYQMFRKNILPSFSGSVAVLEMLDSEDESTTIIRKLYNYSDLPNHTSLTLHNIGILSNSQPRTLNFTNPVPLSKIYFFKIIPTSKLAYLQQHTTVTSCVTSKLSIDKSERRG